MSLYQRGFTSPYKTATPDPELGFVKQSEVYQVEEDKVPRTKIYDEGAVNVTL